MHAANDNDTRTEADLIEQYHAITIQRERVLTELGWLSMMRFSSNDSGITLDCSVGRTHQMSWPEFRALEQRHGATAALQQFLDAYLSQLRQRMPYLFEAAV